MNNILPLEQYPTREGIPIPAHELDIPDFEFGDCDPDIEVSNHHDCWCERRFGRNILYLTLRNLDICQSVPPNDIHDYIHDTYEQPKLPQPSHAFSHILKAAEEGIMIRTGTAGRPEYESISTGLIECVHKNYRKLKRQ